MGLSPSLDRDELVIEDLTLRLMEEAGERRWDTRIVPSQPGDAIAKPYPLSASGGFGASERHMKADGRPSDPTHHSHALNMDTTRESVIQPAPRITYLDYSVKVKKSKGFRIGGYANSRIGGGNWITALDYLKTLGGPGGLWSLAEAVGDALDLSGHGNDGTVTYAEGQRAVLPSLYDRGLPGMRFEEGTTNRALNPSFEVDLSNTSAITGGTQVRDTSKASVGDASMRCDVAMGGGTNQGRDLAVSGSWTAGQAIAVSLELVATIAAGVVVQLYDVTNNIFYNVGSGLRIEPTLSTSAFVRYSMTGTVSTNTSDLRVRIRPSSDAAAFSFWVDAWQVEQKSRATSYCDGSLGTGYSWASTAHASTSTRVATSVNLGSGDELDNIFDGGGAVGVAFNFDAPVGNNIYRIVGKGDNGLWDLSVSDAGASAAYLRFSLGFNAQDGLWTSDVPVIPRDVDMDAFVTYNASASANNPTIYLLNRETGDTTTLTVGDGLTRTRSPAGTREDDSTESLLIGNRPSDDRTFYGVIGPVRVWQGTQPTEGEIAEFFALAQEASSYSTTAVGGGSPSSGVEQFVEYGPYLYGLAGTHTVVINPDLDTPTVVESRFHGNAARARSGDRFNTRLAVALGDEVEAEVATSPYAEERPTAWETAAGVRMSVYQRGSAGRLFSARGERAYSVLPGRDPAVALNYNPSNGEEITDPSDPVRAMREFAAALVAGTARTARTIDPDRGYQSVALLPESRLSASERDGRAMIVVGPQLFHATTQGVNILTLNAPPQPVGPEELENNDTPFKGGEPGIPDYTGKFIAWPYYYPATGDSVIFLMRRRRPDEPGTGTHVWYDHLYLQGRICRSVYFWGGSATRGPRLFFDAQTEANSRQVGWVDWDEDTAKPALSATLTYPMDDFGQPGLTLECERIEFPNVEGADASNYGVWKVKPLGGSFVSLVSDQTGAGNPERITDTGYQQVFMPNASIATASGKGLQFRCEVTQATGATAPVRFRGNPLAYIAARPAHVQEVTAVFDVETERTKTAEELKAALEAKFGRKVLMQHAPGNVDTYIRLVSVQTTEVEVRGSGGDKSDRRVGVSATFRQVAVA